jgi:hypothetical protein
VDLHVSSEVNIYGPERSEVGCVRSSASDARKACSPVPAGGAVEVGRLPAQARLEKMRPRGEGGEMGELASVWPRGLAAGMQAGERRKQSERERTDN